MAERRMATGSMKRGVLVALLAGGLVLGVSRPALAATPLGSKPGASSGCMLGPRYPCTSSNVVAPAREVIPLGAKPGVISGSNVVRRAQSDVAALSPRRSDAASAVA